MANAYGTRSGLSSPFFDAGVTELRVLYETAFTVRHVATGQLATCRPNDPADEVRSDMERQHFDVLLFDEGTPFEKYVAAATLRDGRCVDHAQQIRPAHLITDAAYLSVLLPRMRTTSWRFVLT